MDDNLRYYHLHPHPNHQLLQYLHYSLEVQDLDQIDHRLDPDQNKIQDYYYNLDQNLGVHQHHHLHLHPNHQLLAYRH